MRVTCPGAVDPGTLRARRPVCGATLEREARWPRRPDTASPKDRYDVVLRPGSEAEAAYRSAVLAPGLEPDPGLDLRYLGGKTLPESHVAHVYLGTWDADARAQLDHALPAAMNDRGLNNVLAQYFPKAEVTATFAGSQVHTGKVPSRVYRDTVETLVAGLDLGPAAACILLPPGAVLVDGDSTGGQRAVKDPDDDEVDSKHGLGGYHGSVSVGGSARYYAVAVYSEGDNGIVAFDEPWKNVCATLYHELQETRTRPGRRGRDPRRVRARRGELPRLVLVAWRRDRRHPDGGAGGQLDLVVRRCRSPTGAGLCPSSSCGRTRSAAPRGLCRSRDPAAVS